MAYSKKEVAHTFAHPVTSSDNDLFGDRCVRFSFSRDGQRLALGSQSTATIWDVNSGKKLQTILLPTGWTQELIFSSDNKQITIECLGTITRWDSATAKLLKSIGNSDNITQKLALSPDGNLVAISQDSSSGIFMVRDTATGTKFHTYKNNGCIWDFTFSPDGSRIAVHSVNPPKIYIWDTESGKRLGEIALSSSYLDNSFSKEGTNFITTHYQESPSIWQLAPKLNLRSFVLATMLYNLKKDRRVLDMKTADKHLVKLIKNLSPLVKNYYIEQGVIANFT